MKQYLYSRFSKALLFVIFCVIFNCYDRQLEHGSTPVFLKTYVRKHQNSTQGLSTYVHFEAPHPYLEKYVEARKKFSIILIWCSPQRSLATSLSLNCTILDCPLVLKIYRNIDVEEKSWWRTIEIQYKNFAHIVFCFGTTFVHKNKFSFLGSNQCVASLSCVARVEI